MAVAGPATGSSSMDLVEQTSSTIVVFLSWVDHLRAPLHSRGPFPAPRQASRSCKASTWANQSGAQERHLVRTERLRAYGVRLLLGRQRLLEAPPLFPLAAPSAALWVTFGIGKANTRLLGLRERCLRVTCAKAYPTRQRGALADGSA